MQDAPGADSARMRAPHDAPVMTSRTDDLLAIAIQYLTAEKLHFVHEAERNVVRLSLTGTNGTFHCIVHQNPGRARLTVYTIAQIKVPADKRTLVAEFLTRANYGLVIGNFELDFSDGEVRFKTSLDAEHIALGRDAVRDLFLVNVATMDRYFPGLMKVVYGGATPTQAVAEVESAGR